MEIEQMTEQEEKVLEKWMKANYIEFLQAAARDIKKHCDDTMCEDCSFFYYYKQRCMLNDIPKNWEV